MISAEVPHFSRGKQLHLKGHGDGLHVELEPCGDVRLGPVLPGTENCGQELVLVNPTEYTIEAAWLMRDFWRIFGVNFFLRFFFDGSFGGLFYSVWFGIFFGVKS